MRLLSSPKEFSVVNVGNVIKAHLSEFEQRAFMGIKAISFLYGDKETVFMSLNIGLGFAENQN
jgi:hypothetical protein